MVFFCKTAMQARTTAAAWILCKQQYMCQQQEVCGDSNAGTGGKCNSITRSSAAAVQVSPNADKRELLHALRNDHLGY